MSREAPSASATELRSFCRVCVAACGILVTTHDGEAVRIRGDRSHPLSKGYTCEKGRSQIAHSRSENRLLSARWGRAETSRPVAAATLLDDMAGAISRIVGSDGPDAVATYAGGGASLDTSGWIAFGRLTRALGTRSRYTPLTIDCPAKPLIADLMAGNTALIPQPAPDTRLTMMLGSNPVVSHGHAVAFPNPINRLKALARQGSLVVVDPRRTETARLATTHVAVRPGSDFALLAFLVRAILDDGADEEYLARFTVGRDELVQAVAPFDVRMASDVCGVRRDQLEDLVASVREARRVAVITGTGCTMSQHANLCEWLAWCLALVTGSFDRPGGMWFHPGFLARHDIKKARSSREPGPGPKSRPELVSRWHELPSAALVDEIEAGHVRALIVAGGNPIAALPDTKRVIAALESLDVLAVADVVDTDTARCATHVMPTAAPLERADLTYKTEQLFQAVAAQYTAAVSHPPGDAKPLWWWCVELGLRLGFDLLEPRKGAGDEDAAHIREASEDAFLATLCDAGTFEHLQATQSLMTDQREVFGWVHDNGLPFGHWRLAPPELVAELVSVSTPTLMENGLVLTPRRQRRHHNSTHSPGGDTCSAVMSEQDATGHGIADGALVRVTSPYGSLVTRAHVDPNGRVGYLSLSHGFEALNVNNLTSARELNPLTGMPVFSGVRVEVSPIDAEVVEPREHVGP